MSDSNLTSLRKAFDQSPENAPLLMMLLRELDSNDGAEEAFDLLQQKNPNLQELQDRLFAANLALKAGGYQWALERCPGDSADELMVQAKACLGLNNHEAGLEAYRKAVSLSPALEDLDLENSLKSKVVDLSQRIGAAKGTFKVFSNKNQDNSQKGNHFDPDLIPVLKPQESEITFEDVGGLEEIKKQIHRKIILPFEKPSLFQKFKKKVGGGVLLYGPPGCGKTLLARATSGECHAKFYNVAITDILDMWMGESERKLNAVFEQARRTSPSVLFFDELEALAGKRQHNTDSSASKMVSQFLSEMDGFSQNNQGVLILGATNVPWSIDPAFRRPGRFDRIQFVPPPDKTAREAILKILLSDRPHSEDISLGQLAKATSGFSGADLSNLIESACDVAIEHSIESGKEHPISGKFLNDALKEVKPSTYEWLTTARNYAKYSNEGGQYDDVVNFLSKFGK